MAAERRVVAQVFVRSPSGRSLRELGDAPPPADLSPYMPSADPLQRVADAFRKRGFRAFCDDAGTIVSIEGGVRLFERVFGASEERLCETNAASAPSLRVPADLAASVDSIVVTPPPEFFGV